MHIICKLLRVGIEENKIKLEKQKENREGKIIRKKQRGG